MKTARFLSLMMFAVVSLPGKGLVAQASPAPQHASSQTAEKSAADQAIDQQKGTEVRNQNEPVGSAEADVNEKRLSPTKTKHPLIVGHAKPAQSHQSRSAMPQTTSSPQSMEPGNVAALRETSSKSVTAVPNKTVGHQSASVPSSAVSVNGQQFKNSREPGARMATTGGPANTTRGAAGINGTSVKRKP